MSGLNFVSQRAGLSCCGSFDNCCSNSLGLLNLLVHTVELRRECMALPVSFIDYRCGPDSGNLPADPLLLEPTDAPSSSGRLAVGRLHVRCRIAGRVICHCPFIQLRPEPVVDLIRPQRWTA